MKIEKDMEMSMGKTEEIGKWDKEKERGKKRIWVNRKCESKNEMENNRPIKGKMKKVEKSR